MIWDSWCFTSKSTFFSFMWGRLPVFQGCTSTKQLIKSLAEIAWMTQHSDSGEFRTCNLRSQVYHSTNWATRLYPFFSLSIFGHQYLHWKSSFNVFFDCHILVSTMQNIGHSQVLRIHTSISFRGGIRISPPPPPPPPYWGLSLHRGTYLLILPGYLLIRLESYEKSPWKWNIVS